MDTIPHRPPSALTEADWRRLEDLIRSQLSFAPPALQPRYTPRQAAERLHISISTMRDLIARQQIGSYKIAGRRFLSQGDLDRYESDHHLTPLFTLRPFHPQPNGDAA